jgi:ferredoxin--NADP+ reductase
VAAFPLRVAIVGSGPAGFYSADALLKNQAVPVTVDMFERLPVPFGLVRFGVAPDHQSIKRVQAAFEKTAQLAGFRFFGNVRVGVELPIQELARRYHAVLIAVGAPTDKHLGVPGEELAGSYAATSFVGWYNGHPDFVGESFDLTSERAVVVGMGNVALDVARMLVRRPEELAVTDIAGYALEALQKSRIREVVLLGRRGPAQAAFDQGELKDIAELEGVQVSVDGELPPEDPSRLDAPARKNLEYVTALAGEPLRAVERRVKLRFLTSPAELLGEGGRVRGVKVEKNVLVQQADGSMAARGSGEFDVLPAGVVLRSIGYRGVELPGVPFDARSGTIPNEQGRVTESRGGAPVPGLYTVGWIKRGPTGLIGTNKACAKESAEAILADAEKLAAAEPAAADIASWLAERGLRPVTFQDWHRLDQLEQEAGKVSGKVREKYVKVEDMLSALGL